MHIADAAQHAELIAGLPVELAVDVVPVQIKRHLNEIVGGLPSSAGVRPQRGNLAGRDWVMPRRRNQIVQERRAVRAGCGVSRGGIIITHADSDMSPFLASTVGTVANVDSSRRSVVPSKLTK